MVNQKGIMYEVSITELITDIDRWVDLIDETSGCADGNFDISDKCDELIKKLIEYINDINNPPLNGKYFFTEENYQYGAGQAVTNDVEQLGIHVDHDGVWEFNGRIHNDGYTWVENILVYFHHADGSGSDYIIGHNKCGLVFSNEKVFGRFIKRFPTTTWDYGDI